MSSECNSHVVPNVKEIDKGTCNMCGKYARVLYNMYLYTWMHSASYTTIDRM